MTASAGVDDRRGRRGQIRLYLTFLGGWIFASVLLVSTVMNRTAEASAVTPAWLFVLGTGALVAALINRDVASRREADQLLAEREELIDSIGIVTDPRLSQLPLHQLLDELLGRARDVLAADKAGVFLFDRAGGLLELSASHGLEGLDDVHVTVPVGQGLVGGVAASLRAEAVADVALRPSISPVLAGGMRSLAAAPLMAEGNLIGVLQIGTIARRELRDDDMRLLQLVADRAAFSIEASRLDQEARRATMATDAARSHLLLLADAGAVLARPFASIDELPPAMVDVLVPTFADWYAFNLGDQRVVATDEPDAGDALSATDGWRDLVRDVIEVGEPRLLWGPTLRVAHLLPDLDASGGAERRQVRRDPEGAITSIAIVPMSVRGEVVGTLALGTSGVRRGYRPSDLAAIADLAARVGLTYERVLLETETRDSAARNAEQAAELRQLYGDVQASDARLRALYDASPVGIVELDGDGAAVRWNRAAADTFGWLGYDDESRPVALPAAAVEVAMRALYSQVGSAGEIALARDERRFDLELASVPLRESDGAVRGVVLAVVDVTERRQVAEQLQQASRMEAMARLAGGVAHDFNNVLMVITGYTDLLLRRADVDAAAKGDVESIRKAATRAADMTRKLLTVSRHQSSTPEVVAIDDVLASLHDVLAVMLGSAIDLRVAVDEPLPVFIDPSQLEQVLLNLALNAKDAMPNGGTLSIEASAVVDGGERRAELRVVDDGDGMDADAVEHCFEPFFTTKDRTKGSGLGLATVYGVVHQAGGEIQVVSTPGQGTSFVMRFPAVRAQLLDGQRSLEPPDVIGSGDVEALVLRVLVVDDESELRAIVRDLLELEGHDVTVAADADAALAAADAEVPDVLLTDVVMPNVDGVELARRMTERHPSVKVLFMSAHVGDTLRRGVAIEPARLLAKPFSPAELMTKLYGLFEAQGSKR